MATPDDAAPRAVELPDRAPGTAPELTAELARDVLDAQPFSRLLGTRLVEIAPGRAVLELEVDERLLQQHGVVHGGVLAYLADNALTFAGGSVLGPQVLTASVDVEYVAPATSGVLRAVATVVHRTDRKAVCDCEITVDLAGQGPSGQGPSACAVARGTVLAVRSVP